MEIDGAAGSPADNGRSWNESTPTPETPFLSPTNSYSTPGSNPLATPVPEKERIDYTVTESAVSHATVSELALASASSASSPANVLSPVSRQADDDVGSGHSKNRKRKRTADVDDPTARTASQNATSPYDRIQAAASQLSLLADDEDLVVSDDLSSLSSTPGSPLLEPADPGAIQEPSPLDVTFSRLTEREISKFVTLVTIFSYLTFQNFWNDIPSAGSRLAFGVVRLGRLTNLEYELVT
ncbi:hypothetical protein N7478_003794 [Penicillium angulare]|uniref:uncharacterized protein n=1 Tax=Penicillium angulare TaxID=116970 RepID=UPI0025416D42|nr:uncharacterized protein N7478_003794 [Penicillium angulare]KAJ5288108.1 hypothetical protein N7478_003794 [Penicillium angulare]